MQLQSRLMTSYLCCESFLSAGCAELVIKSPPLITYVTDQAPHVPQAPLVD